MIIVVYSIQKYLWNPDKTTEARCDHPIHRLCIAYKSIFEILIKQQIWKRKENPRVVYSIQKYLWNPDKTTSQRVLKYIEELCIAYKSIFEILIKQPLVGFVLLLSVVYSIQKYLWNPDKTTRYGREKTTQELCIAYKSIFEILIKQQGGQSIGYPLGCV